MRTSNILSKAKALIFSLTFIALAQTAYAADIDDVLKVVHLYGSLEGDLTAQANLMAEDRVHITNGNRQTNQARNEIIQVSNRTRQEQLNGGKTEYITSIEDIDISIVDNVAIVSFKQWWNILPAKQTSLTSDPQWVTLVLIKDSSDWTIKHTHQSPVRGN